MIICMNQPTEQNDMTGYPHLLLCYVATEPFPAPHIWRRCNDPRGQWNMKSAPAPNQGNRMQQCRVIAAHEDGSTYTPLPILIHHMPYSPPDQTPEYAAVQKESGWIS